MEYTIFKDSKGKEVKISKIVLGGSSKQMIEGTYPDSFFDEMLKAGINTIDLARLYGNGKCESFFGDYLSKRNRDDFTIISKCCHPKWGIFKRVNRKAALNDIQATLKALKTDHVDIYLLHRDDSNVPVSKIVDFMNEIVQRGYARVIGVSNWSLDRIIQANLYAKQMHLVPFQVIENQYSLVERMKDSWHNGAKAFNSYDLMYLKDNGLTPICYSSLAEGYLSGKYKSSDPQFVKSLHGYTRVAYNHKENFERLQRLEEIAKQKNESVAKLALAYLLTHESNPSAIVSMSSTRRIQDNVSALDIKLAKEERDYLFGRND